MSMEPITSFSSNTIVRGNFEVFTNMTIIIDQLNIFNQEHVYNRNPEIKMTRNILLFFISIVFTIYVISFGIILYSLSINYRTNTYEPVLMLFWISFFASGLFITKNYYPQGLYIFGWLGILNIILSCAVTVLVSVGIIIITSQSPQHITEITFIMIPVVIGLTNIIIETIIVIYSFKLWYLILKHQHLQNHPAKINIEQTL